MIYVAVSVPLLASPTLIVASLILVVTYQLRLPLGPYLLNLWPFPCPKDREFH